MARKRITLRLSDEYVRANRERVQRDYDHRERLRILEQEVERRWYRDPGRYGDVGVAACVEAFGDHWVVVRKVSCHGVERRRYRFEIVGDHVLLDEPPVTSE